MITQELCREWERNPAMIIRSHVLFVLVALAGAEMFAQQAPMPAGQGEQLTAEAIMLKVAANQDKDEAERSHYVYVQHARVVSRRGKTVMCEEVTDVRVTPSSKGSHQQLIKLDGRVLDKHTYVAYDTLLPDKNNPAAPVEAEHHTIETSIGDTDQSLVEGLRIGLTNDTGDKDAQAKDGVGAGLFPLTTKSQAEDAFTLVGREQMNGREVFHIAFRPKDKSDYGWKGDAYIDSTAYQPVVVSTTMNRNLPFGVRTLMGTSLPGLGFTVVYAPQADGVWFPVSFSTEFKIHVLFFFKREITIDAKNRDFLKTHSEGNIVDPEAEK